jgi:hypothetical protein
MTVPGGPIETRTVIRGRINRLTGGVVGPSGIGVRFRVGNVACRAVFATCNLIAEHRGWPGHEVQVEGYLDDAKKVVDVEAITLVD